MLFERIVSPGLAQFSYLIGDGVTAVVIDPRRDVDIYLEKAAAAGMHIRYILETHRHEDFVVGSIELAARTGADIYHADAQLSYQYGQPVTEGQAWAIGQYRLEALHTPGHTLGSISYVLYEPSGAPWMVFTGDVLFAGDVGRVDFYGMDKAPEMAGMLYDAIFDRLLPLGDGVLVCPTHGAGSACGAGIADRPWTTLGLERRLNPLLQHHDRDDFVTHAARELEKPLYFDKVEELNLDHAPLLHVPTPPPLSPVDFERKMMSAVVVDTRSDLAFGAAHIPAAQYIGLEQLARFAGWFLHRDRAILLVTEGAPDPAVRYLVRLGFENIEGYLAGDMWAWHTSGRSSRATRMATVDQLCRILDAGRDPWILDVRSDGELVAQGEIPGAHHIHVTQLYKRRDQVPKHEPVFIFCGSGTRAMIAASFLQRGGWKDVVVVLGGLAGWNATTCQLP